MKTVFRGRNASSGEKIPNLDRVTGHTSLQASCFSKLLWKREVSTHLPIPLSWGIHWAIVGHSSLGSKKEFFLMLLEDFPWCVILNFSKPGYYSYLIVPALCRNVCINNNRSQLHRVRAWGSRHPLFRCRCAGPSSFACTWIENMGTGCTWTGIGCFWSSTVTNCTQYPGLRQESHSLKVAGDLARLSEAPLRLLEEGHGLCCSQQCKDESLDSQPFPTNPQLAPKCTPFYFLPTHLQLRHIPTLFSVLFWRHALPPCQSLY